MKLRSLLAEYTYTFFFNAYKYKCFSVISCSVPLNWVFIYSQSIYITFHPSLNMVVTVEHIQCFLSFHLNIALKSQIFTNKLKKCISLVFDYSAYDLSHSIMIKPNCSWMRLIAFSLFLISKLEVFYCNLKWNSVWMIETPEAWVCLLL